MVNNVTALRAMLTKSGIPGIQFELRRNGPSEFEMIEDGRMVGVSFEGLGIRETWDKCISKRYSGYRVSDVEEWVPE